MVKLKVLTSLSSLFVLLNACVKYEHADAIVHNGTIYTCNEQFEVVQAMAIKDGKIIELGAENHILNKYTADRHIDLKKRTVIPTFFDAHSYLLAKTLKRNTLEYSAEVENDFRENGQVNYIYNVPEEILASLNYSGYRYLARTSSGNSLKIDTKTYAAVFKEEVKSPPIISNKDSISKVVRFFENYSSTKADYLIMEQQLFSNGYAGFTSFGVRSQVAQNLLSKSSSFYQQLVLEGGDESFKWLTKGGVVDTGNTRLYGLSYFIDGSFGSKQALLKAKYTDSGFGKLFNNEKELEEISALCSSLKFQLIFHAYGDSAFKIATNVMGDALKSVNDKRWRVEHCQLTDNEDLKTLKAHSILPSVQPTQAIWDKKAHLASIGKGRSCASYNFTGLTMQNKFLTSGSLYPIDGMNPTQQYIELIRTDSCRFGIDRKSALKALTIWPAMAAFFDDVTGSLEQGKNADFLILNLDVLKASESTLENTAVLETFVRGKSVFKKTN